MAFYGATSGGGRSISPVRVNSLENIVGVIEIIIIIFIVCFFLAIVLAVITIACLIYKRIKEAFHD